MPRYKTGTTHLSSWRFKRAYSYLSCSMEDAVACNARLRLPKLQNFIQLSTMHILKRSSRKRMVVILLVCMGILAILLIILASYLYYGLKNYLSHENIYTFPTKNCKQPTKVWPKPERLKKYT